uniref:Uncharacterized protein n=1 Tax=Tanacetum cinerariifolium TaxID=118510 RepID=A0A6L2MWC9_TANCI|nr:hypothetical protein [Tanacetum cinerariifolium]
MEHDKVAQNLEITKLKTRVKKLDRANKVKTLKLRRLRKVGTSKRADTSDDTVMEDVSNQRRMIDELDKDEGAVLMNEKEETEEVKDITGDVQVEGSETFNVAVVVPIVTAAIVPTVIVASVKVVVPSTRRRRGVVIRDPEEESSAKTPTKTKSKDKGKGIMVEEPKPMKKKQQVNLDKALDYFKGMSYDDIRPIFEAKFNSNIKFLLKSKEQIEEEENRAIVSINETPAQKAAKRRRLNEEARDVEELKQHLEIVPDEDDDVYTEATPLARKNFDREDLESLCSIVKERFSTSKPNNFSDDFLLTTLIAMFGRPDGQDQVWMSQRSVHGQAKVKSWKLLESCGVHIVALTTTQLIMLVERRYPLSSAAEKNNDAKSRKDYPLTSAMLLLVGAITQNFSNATNNRLRTSSNTKNQAFFQGDWDEARVILTDEQNDFLFADASRMEEIEDLSANMYLMARIQPTNHSYDVGPSYDSAFVNEKNEEFQETHLILKSQMSEKEDSYHDTIIDLEDKLRKNVDLILKLGNSLQGMFILGPKPLSVYDQQLNMV